MTAPRLLLLALASVSGLCATVGEPSPGASDLVSAFSHLSLDSERAYHVRDLQLVRGGVTFYLTDGALRFFRPVDGHLIAALFTTQGFEAGDAEMILMPPQRSERASLAYFTHSPNMDEHFSSALFFFSDTFANEVEQQQRRDGGSARPVPELPPAFASQIESLGRAVAEQLQVRLVQALLDKHAPADGFFYAIVAGHVLGTFDLLYDPANFEPVSVGRAAPPRDAAEHANASNNFQLWSNFRPRHAPPFIPPPPRLTDFHIESTIHDDLSLTARASFKLKASVQDGRAISFTLTPRLRITAATLNGEPAEVLRRRSFRLSEFGSAEPFLLVSDKPLVADREYDVELRYEGSVIHKTAAGEYFVDDRNTWYPVIGPVFTNFDLIFHCPERLRLVSTGELISEKTGDGIRTVHRKTAAPAALAGFNLGDYGVRNEERGLYSVQVYSRNSATFFSDPTLPRQALDILSGYTRLWQPLSSRNLSITPIAGYFGQGFPGLIYLSLISYVKQENRPPALRNPRLDAFFTGLLLSHEIAHQWWGNIVREANYRAGWITEAMANDSALEYLARIQGLPARDDVLESYRRDLLHSEKGETVESAGPVDFGERLIDTHGLLTWQVIVYEKGSWILHMLRERLGPENFRQMQLALLQEYATRPLSNDDLRQVASRFVPAGQPDPSLETFFDAWVYGTGIPAIDLHQSGRTLDIDLAGVDDDFLVDLPLHCKGKERVHWIRVGAGANSLNLPAGTSACELPSPRQYLYKDVHEKY